MLRRHGVAHTFNSWSRMPPVVEQMKASGNDTADFTSARFLLKPGRSYEQAVKSFQAYTEIKEPYQEGRNALAKPQQGQLLHIPIGHDVCDYRDTDGRWGLFTRATKGEMVTGTGENWQAQERHRL